jgi:hypothetical protein
LRNYTVKVLTFHLLCLCSSRSSIVRVRLRSTATCRPWHAVRRPWWCMSWWQRLAAENTTELHLGAGHSFGGRVVTDIDRWRTCGGNPPSALGGEGFHSTNRLVASPVWVTQLATPAEERCDGDARQHRSNSGSWVRG